MSTTVRIVIPARYGSSRLPGKPLADIAGKPMIQHVVERAMTVKGAAGVVVATDDQRVFDAVSRFGGTAVMTSTHHDSGTDRLVEVASHFPADVYVNIQGDEPLFDPVDVEKLIECMIGDERVDVGTLYHTINAEEARNPNSVKVVLNSQDDALYFSRSPIPFDRDNGGGHYLKHIGIYGYRHAVLAQYSALPRPALETTEKLEQLRLLHAGFRIRCVEVNESAAGVDTPACLERVRAVFEGREDLIKAVPSLADIKLIITDVDGVLTNGLMGYTEHGESIKMFHVRDGLGMRVLEMSGIKVAVLSGRDSPVLRKRLSDLEITHIRLGESDKRSACRELMNEVGVNAYDTLFLGDDTLDLPAFQECGIAVSVKDAPLYIQNKADIVLSLSGGEGAFRELADALLQAQGKFDCISTAEGYEQLAGFKAQ